ncbi:MAG TPA: 2TM domain-containing protein [Mycobacteriales bacterium]|jgi:hypothetical protein|nr:2TM domain-containing protein [Mycobacteriales bacterium]
MTVTLEQYEDVERAMSMREARVGLMVHVVVTLVVWAALIPVNVIVAPEFPWSAFVVGGMGIGLFFHWFGYRHAETDIRRRQQEIESRARTARI